MLKEEWYIVDWLDYFYIKLDSGRESKYNFQVRMSLISFSYRMTKLFLVKKSRIERRKIDENRDAVLIIAL